MRERVCVCVCVAGAVVTVREQHMCKQKEHCLIYSNPLIFAVKVSPMSASSLNGAVNAHYVQPSPTLLSQLNFISCC